MKKNLTGFLVFYFALNVVCFSQVDTTYVYNVKTPYGGLDIRIAKSATNYYHLQEDQTFSFRESSSGVRTNTFYDMTQWDSGPYKQGHLREKTDGGDNFVMNYRLLMPDGYDPAFAEGYPILMMMHGFGERGNCDNDICYHADRTWNPVANSPAAPTNADNELLNNDHNLLHGGQAHLLAVQRAKGKLPGDDTMDPRAFPGFVFFPQNLNGWDHFAVQDAIRTLRLLIKKYNIDEDRVYVEGISNGGHGLYEAIKRAPWLFSGAVAMSAIDDGFINSQGIAASIAHIPLWIFQGGMDVNPYPSKTRRYIQQFRSAGGNPRYTLYPELGHGTWNKAFGEQDFFAWMLGQSKADLHSFEGSTFICSEQGTRLELAPGFMAYQWQFNGATIAGADSAVFYAKSPGAYRARFSRVSNPAEAQWNEWSDPITLAVTDPPEAGMSQIGTVVLKDLNGYANARLESAEEHDHYYWYRNDNLLDLPGTEDDTLRVATIAPAYGNGAYTLVVADHGCRSVPSAPKHVIFNNQAPINISAPTQLTGVSVGPSENTLSWKDVSSNEGGFEIWRRKKLSATTWGPWEMGGITGPNAVTFDDSGLEPSMTYQYKGRAVRNTGRSEYTPAPLNEGVIVETALDTEVPSAPTELFAESIGVEKIRLTWKPSTDNTRIREYVVTINGDTLNTGTADTTFMLTELPPNMNYEINVKAMDLSRNLSAASNTVEMSTHFSGLYYEHTTGSWISLDSIDWSWAEVTGKVSGFNLSKKTQDDYYNFSCDGYLYIENGGNYQLRVGSSDGTRLWLDNKLMVNNNGVHDYKVVTSGTVPLQPGPHRIYLQYFEHTGLDSLLVEYKGPDTQNEWIPLSRTVLKSDKDVVTAIGNPDNGPEDSFRVSVFPNPTTQDNIHVLVETVIPEPVQVMLFDPMGRNLFEGIFQPDEILRGVSISPPGVMNTGIYFVMVTQGELRVRERVVVKRE